MGQLVGKMFLRLQVIEPSIVLVFFVDQAFRMLNTTARRRSGLRIIRKRRVLQLLGSLLAWLKLIVLNNRRISNPRIRKSFAEVTASLTDEEFKQMFRMTQESFNLLVGRFSSYISGPMQEHPQGIFEHCGHRNNPNGSPGRAATAGNARAISVKVKVAIFLCMMAGGSYHDLALLFGIAECTVYKIFRDCLKTAEEVLDWAVLPDASDIEEFKHRALSFAWSRKKRNPLPGCVGAIDGIHVKLERPAKKHGPRQFYSRKGFFSIPVQAMVDHKYRFVACSAICKGSTHDSVALRLSIIGRFFEEEGLPDGFHVAGDDAYSGYYPEQLITPYRRALASKYELSFNYFQSSHRVHVEQAFGILMRRWGILWRPLRFKLDTVSLIVSVSMLLHNFCIDMDGGVVKRVPSQEEKALASEELENWLNWMTGENEEHPDATFGMANDSIPERENMHLEEKSKTRANLVRLLRMKSILPPEHKKKSWLEIAEDAPEHFYDSDESDEKDSAGDDDGFNVGMSTVDVGDYEMGREESILSDDFSRDENSDLVGAEAEQTNESDSVV